MFDLLIRQGEICDGTGRPVFHADLGIAGRTISAIGHLAQAEARLTINAENRLVCPGFIDAHSHSDAYILIDPRAVSKIYQGITTEICGNCGASAAPRRGAAQLPSDWAAQSYPGQWQSVAEYRHLLATVRPALNIALLIGHNTLRASVLGYDARQATPAELAQMQRLLEQSLEEGGCGLSTGLIYPPGMFAAADEILALAKLVAQHNGIYASHMRNEGRNLPAAIDETIQVCRAAGVRTQISHLKTAGRANWHLIEPALERIRAARAAGLPLAADRYPYVSSCTDLDVVFPAWAEAGGREAILARLRQPAERARLRAEILAFRSEESWDAITIASTHHPDNLVFRGQPLPAVARRLGLEPVDALLCLVEKDEVRTTAFFSGMSEENMWRFLAEPYVMLGTDASLRAPDGPLSRDYPHPRAYGALTRFLRAALDGRTVPLAEAIRKMTALPAEQFGLRERGRLATGLAADVVILDPHTLQDHATYPDPHRLSQGVESVIVNGCLTLAAGKPTGQRGGEFLA